MPDCLSVERKEHIALVTMNRPQVMNAINSEMALALRAACTELDGDEDVRAIVLTGAGKAFSAGADLKERAGLSLPGIEAQRRALVDAFSAVGTLSKPIIAAVNGHALGGGFELALLCDFIISSYRARFGLPEVTRGLIPGCGGTQTLPRLVGKALAKEIILTGRVLDAEEALAARISIRLVPAGALVEEAMKTAKAIARNAPLAVIQAKKAVNIGADVDLQTGMAFELECYHYCLHTEDREEGIRAFVEKRAPVFKGR